MKTLEALQRDMDTATDLQSIVRTMKVLAAVSIRQYEKALVSLADYNRTVELGLQAVLRRHRVVAPGRGQKPLQTGAIIFGSDHGLCGRYNESIVTHAMKELDNAGGRRILAVGSRIEASLHARGQEVEARFFVPGSVAGMTPLVQNMLLHIDNWQREGIERVLLFNNVHEQRTAYRARVRALLPVDLSLFNRTGGRSWPSRSLPLATMDSEKLLRSLIRQHLFIALFSACAESLAGEHASRLISMQVAEKNIQQRLESLTATYRQQRQNQITEELLDVVSGFEALGGGQ
ncbi:F0F1 ATP synthase subunit gamma [Methylobacter sp. YRD-M1]|uniref:F0F1 ATP synthase subunit gamma n=1 Tax=Methylobacter sp. YRD-M1 TaxID=2911520 RepID=UPI00227D2CE4|nr:F0F1 ATP synthase subunit gamma [Methylobacter sp. YRD-M1]WAK03937.1 F0F1 ATP synthase subunit gamma [Methylobacter sp. YRD-M1]